jgi:hypothetical protein
VLRCVTHVAGFDRCFLLLLIGFLLVSSQDRVSTAVFQPSLRSNIIKIWSHGLPHIREYFHHTKVEQVHLPTSLQLAEVVQKRLWGDLVGFLGSLEKYLF